MYVRVPWDGITVCDYPFATKFSFSPTPKYSSPANVRNRRIVSHFLNFTSHPKATKYIRILWRARLIKLDLHSERFRCRLVWTGTKWNKMVNATLGRERKPLIKSQTKLLGSYLLVGIYIYIYEGCTSLIKQLELFVCRGFVGCGLGMSCFLVCCRDVLESRKC